MTAMRCPQNGQGSRKVGSRDGATDGCRMTHTPKAYFISRLKLERVKNNLCDAHNSVASRDVSTRASGPNLLSDHGFGGLPSVSRTAEPAGPHAPRQGGRLINSSAAPARRRHAARHIAEPPRTGSRQEDGAAKNPRDTKRPAGSDRPVERRFAYSLWQPSPPMVPEHYQAVIFASNGTMPLGLPSCCDCCRWATARSIIAQCLIFHLASQQGSGKIPVPYVMPSRCEAL